VVVVLPPLSLSMDNSEAVNNTSGGGGSSGVGGQ